MRPGKREGRALATVIGLLATAPLLVGDRPVKAAAPPLMLSARGGPAPGMW